MQGQDLASGNLTAPVLFALEHLEVGPKLRALIKTEFAEDGSLDAAIKLVNEGGGIERSRLLARVEGDTALRALAALPDSDAKRSLEGMVEYVLKRVF